MPALDHEHSAATANIAMAASAVHRSHSAQITRPGTKTCAAPASELLQTLASHSFLKQPEKCELAVQFVTYNDEIGQINLASCLKLSRSLHTQLCTAYSI